MPKLPLRCDFALLSLRGLYRHYCYVLGVIRDNNRHPYYSAALRSDIRKLDDYSHQAQMLEYHGIDTAGQLQAFLDTAKAEITALTKERDRVYKQISRCEDESALQPLLRQRDDLTAKITALRRDVKSADAVMKRSGEVAEKVRIAQEPEKLKEMERRR